METLPFRLLEQNATDCMAHKRMYRSTQSRARSPDRAHDWGGWLLLDKSFLTLQGSHMVGGAKMLWGALGLSEGQILNRE